MFVRAICRRTSGQALSWNSHAVMPLRAKIINPAFGAQAKVVPPSPNSSIPWLTETQMSTSSEGKQSTSNSLEDIDEPEDVLFNATYGVRTIELNRPSKLHSLNGSMIRKIIPRLQEWTKSDMANVIIMKGAGPKAFCAGGDVATLAKWNSTGLEGEQKSTDYFANEYQLDHLIATYKKPYIAFMDGITMGGGVGLSVHAPFRIATERTVFAMPETTIGFFPDVGASFFLSRMPGAVGTYLALTSDRLTGANAFYAGLATHYIHSSTLPALEARLGELRFKDYHTLAERLPLIDATIEEFCTGLPHDQPIHLAGELRKAIDRCFSKTNINDILQALHEEIERGEMKEWAEKTIETLNQRSPTSVVTALRQMQIGKTWGIRQTFFREYHMAAKFMRHPDFTEGVSALLISKPRRTPTWSPPTLADIESDSTIADDMLTPNPAIKEFELLDTVSDSGDWTEYPWKKYGIPTEEEVEMVWRRTVEASADKQGNWKRRVSAWFVKERKGKQGIKEVVDEIVDRLEPRWNSL